MPTVDILHNVKQGSIDQIILFLSLNQQCQSKQLTWREPKELNPTKNDHPLPSSLLDNPSDS